MLRYSAIKKTSSALQKKNMSYSPAKIVLHILIDTSLIGTYNM